MSKDDKTSSQIGGLEKKITLSNILIYINGSLQIDLSDIKYNNLKAGVQANFESISPKKKTFVTISSSHSLLGARTAIATPNLMPFYNKNLMDSSQVVVPCVFSSTSEPLLIINKKNLQNEGSISVNLEAHKSGNNFQIVDQYSALLKSANPSETNKIESIMKVDN